MTDARQVCAALCEASQLALYLARRGRDAGLHRDPLFSGPGAENGSAHGSMVRESRARPWTEWPGNVFLAEIHGDPRRERKVKSAVDETNGAITKMEPPD